MKLWYDDKKIPMWVELVAVLVVAVIGGISFGLILLGYNLAYFLY